MHFKKRKKSKIADDEKKPMPAGKSSKSNGSKR